MSSVARTYARWLWLLTALFFVRVVAQPLSRVIEAEWLPPFDAWQSGVMPYGALAASQAVIAVLLCRVSWRLWRGAVEPDRRSGGILLACGGLYAAAMIVRLGLGVTMLNGHPWFDRPLPTAFHFVLAGFMLAYGHYHFRRGAHA